MTTQAPERKALPNFLSVLDQKLDRMKQALKKELEKPKKERTKQKLRILIRDTKTLKKTIKDARQENNNVCPHCGKVIE